MKTLRSFRGAGALAAAGVLLAGAEAAQAASAFNGGATLTYTIDSIVNLDNPGAVAGLSVLGSFQQTVSDPYYVSTSGDGAVGADNPAVGPVGVVGSFSKTFSVGGSVADGAAHSSHLGQFALAFDNAGADSYAVQVTLGYQLEASAGGEYADSSVALDYFNADFSFSGNDRVDASVFDVPSPPARSSSVVYAFTLPAGASQALAAEVVISGNAEASPVPVPAAVWLFASGVAGLFGAARRRRA